MYPCLILTPWFTAHAIVIWQRAISQEYSGEIDVLERYEEEARSPSITIRFPAVAKLNKKLKQNRTEIKFSRPNVYARDLYTCQYCGAQPPLNQLTYDHVIPRSKGGKTDFPNIVSACKKCNTKKGDKSLKASGLVLRKKPIIPKSLPMTSHLKLPDMVPSLWLPYLNDKITNIKIPSHAA